MSDAPFQSVHAALVYAFNFSEQQYPETTLAKLIRRAQEEARGGSGDIGTGKGLKGIDGAGQAGMILCEIARMPEDSKQVILARYGRRTKQCGHCGGNELTEDWKAAIEGLAEFTMDHLPIKVDIRLRRTLVHGYFGRKSNYTKLGKQFDLNRETVGVYYAAIAKALRALEYQAQDRLHWQFISCGVVADAMAA